MAKSRVQEGCGKTMPWPGFDVATTQSINHCTIMAHQASGSLSPVTLTEEQLLAETWDIETSQAWFFGEVMLILNSGHSVKPIPGVEPRQPGWKLGILANRPYGTTEEMPAYEELCQSARSQDLFRWVEGGFWVGWTLVWALWQSTSVMIQNIGLGKREVSQPGGKPRFFWPLHVISCTTGPMYTMILPHFAFPLRKHFWL